MVQEEKGCGRAASRVEAPELQGGSCRAQTFPPGFPLFPELQSPGDGSTSGSIAQRSLLQWRQASKAHPWWLVFICWTLTAFGSSHSDHRLPKSKEPKGSGLGSLCVFIVCFPLQACGSCSQPFPGHKTEKMASNSEILLPPEYWD